MAEWMVCVDIQPPEGQVWSEDAVMDKSDAMMDALVDHGGALSANLTDPSLSPIYTAEGETIFVATSTGQKIINDAMGAVGIADWVVTRFEIGTYDDYE